MPRAVPTKTLLTGRVLETSDGETTTYTATGSLSSNGLVLIVKCADGTEMKVSRTSRTSSVWRGEDSVGLENEWLRVKMQGTYGSLSSGLKLDGDWVQSVSPARPSAFDNRGAMVWELWPAGGSDPFAKPDVSKPRPTIRASRRTAERD